MAAAAVVAISPAAAKSIDASKQQLVFGNAIRSSGSAFTPRKFSRFVVKATSDKPAKITADRQLWFASATSLSYLDGTLPGDYGFDPLGLMNPNVGAGTWFTSAWMSYAEIINGRFAMLGVAGAIAPEIFGKIGIIPAETALPWFKTGVIPWAGTYPYWADPYTLFFLEMALMGFAEHRRAQDFYKPGSMGKQYFLGLEKFLGGSGDPAYPGGIFNPLGFGKDEKAMKVLKVKEVKNGRLAMIAILGFFIQAIFTGVGPFQNLLDHLSNPVANNVLTNLKGFNMKEVRAGLYIGDIKDAELVLLGETTHTNVTHMLSLCNLTKYTISDKAIELMDSSKLVRKKISILDHDTQDVLCILNECLEFLEAGIQQGGSVLVHCMQGMSRSATIVMAFLMRKEKLSVVEALESLRRFRNEASPIKSFLDQLKVFQEMGYVVDIGNEAYVEQKLKKRLVPPPAPAAPGGKWISKRVQELQKTKNNC